MKKTNNDRPSVKEENKKKNKKLKSSMKSDETVSTQDTVAIPKVKSHKVKPSNSPSINSVSVTTPADVSLNTNKQSNKEKRKQKRKKRKRLKVLKVFIITLISLLIACGIAAYVYFYYTDSFKIENVQINGVEHLTNEEMEKLADIPKDTTLLKVDIDTIKRRLKMDAWIHDCDVVLSFPNTLVINVKERNIASIVEVPTPTSKINTNQKNKDTIVRNWAISADHVWLMPVPEKDSEAAKNINPRIYNDVEGIMHIVDVSPSVVPEIGSVCTDDIVNCAIDVVASMTTDLKTQVSKVKASDSSSTNLLLKNGVEVSIGNSEDLRNKERVCLELLAKYEGKISYINVRSASTPTWRMI